jgi:hypothetical protein
MLRSLGNQGALTNVQTVLRSREREDWLVEGLARRLDPEATPQQPALPARVA